ncbi:hypothetical protein PC116_g24300 [Phytophthora cactorum]|nr:hypothetical protein PC114_g22431 [Phytophthora cactorum]KAG4227308.1 hypothetical protein PC116_g24300 [Phytophthora cactorum]
MDVNPPSPSPPKLNRSFRHPSSRRSPSQPVQYAAYPTVISRHPSAPVTPTMPDALILSLTVANSKRSRIRGGCPPGCGTYAPT